MPRLACVDVPALPLQILLRREPAWSRHPVAVVERDEPQGRILWVNEAARGARILPGRRYAEALSLCAELRASTVDTSEIDAAVRSLTQTLLEFSPTVEPSVAEPGVSWLDASGLTQLFASHEDWAAQLLARITATGFAARAVVGFTRFHAYALARVGGARALVLASPEDEQRRADQVRLDRLGIDPKLRDALDRLGIDTVGALRRLPPRGLLERFGKDAHGLHEIALGRRAEALVPHVEASPLSDRWERDPEDPRLDAPSLVFLGKRAIARLGQQLAARGEALRALDVTILLDGALPITMRIEPAEPTLDEVQLTELLRLRLESVAQQTLATLPGGVEPTGLELRCDAVRATREQLELFAEAPRRDPKLVDRAIARLRARLGDAAVCRATLRAGHLPEARFRLEALQHLPLARPDRESPPALVRRILLRPRALPDQRPGPDGWFAAGLRAGPVRKLHGPFVISGGWWTTEQHREYHFAEAERGDVLWIFWDRARRRWFEQGAVE
ncbi:MAG: DNA polymerase Y family protein [Planctomycetes bacterium]|nr:DNA polymerase Y family protein [Planctomycetota bacterium]